MPANPTPYNSIYEVIRSSAVPTADLPSMAGCDEVICCTHGKHCDFDDQRKTDEGVDNNKYVNLADVDESERENLIEHMKQELELSDFFNRKKKKSKGKMEELFPRKDKPRSKKKSRKSQKKEKKEVAEMEKGRVEKGHIFKEAYLGARSFLEAEKLLKEKDTSLGLYHRLPTGSEKLDIDEESRLFMAYRLSRDQYRHYVIRSRSTSEDQCTYFVDYGDPRVVGYSDLDDLISIYTDKMRLVEQAGPVPMTSERPQ